MDMSLYFTNIQLLYVFTFCNKRN